ncbi:hypothetical protein F5878DRAFT_625140 [Lentinula raphanica]|uniref:Uncharacterized protein n=1 Tax=Lentinula raphanica TaxID=153919 RepID=A0AA38P512_9AGAR|nr:hypothetical protein F5878DRAFT_625140 [Lentinula raphanica]
MFSDLRVIFSSLLRLIFSIFFTCVSSCCLSLQSQFFPASPQNNLFHIHDSVASTLDFTTSHLRQSSLSAPLPLSSHAVYLSSSSPLFPGRSSINSFTPPLMEHDVLSVWLAEECFVLLDHPLYLYHLREAQRWKSVLQKILSCADDLALVTITDSIVFII